MQGSLLLLLALGFVYLGVSLCQATRYKCKFLHKLKTLLVLSSYQSCDILKFLDSLFVICDLCCFVYLSCEVVVGLDIDIKPVLGRLAGLWEILISLEDNIQGLLMSLYVWRGLNDLWRILNKMAASVPPLSLIYIILTRDYRW